ncbi:MAG TPA: hypothetical protein VLX11_10320 [Candidatus Acidoferrales bacterium]|nr:hypothetical protein [Candidatus Acidoferrales bacterium]
MRFSFILFVSFLARDAYGHFTGKGHVHTLSKTTQVFWNPDCQTTDTCDLKRFSLITSVYEFWFGDSQYPTYSNGVIMEYETDSVAALEKYAIVQFMKGCVFDSSKNADGKIIRSISYTISSFGENVPFCFPDWVIDSQDADPAYNSDPDYGRFYLLRWNKPGSYEYLDHKYYGAEKPKVPIVYMADYPIGAYVRANAVRNAALQFKTCIYKAKDVPTKTRRDDVNFAKPLDCFEWENVYVYDFATRKFEANWADVPRPAEPYLPVREYLLVILVTLFIAVALVTLSGLGSLLGPKDAYFP